MILEFFNGKDKLLYGLGHHEKTGERLLSICSAGTKWVFMPVDQIGKLKPLNKKEREALEETIFIVKNSVSDEAAKNYIISENLNLGFEFVGLMDVEVYLERYKKDGFRK